VIIAFFKLGNVVWDGESAIADSDEAQAVVDRAFSKPQEVVVARVGPDGERIREIVRIAPGSPGHARAAIASLRDAQIIVDSEA
jgi:hypothetical protein